MSRRSKFIDLRHIFFVFMFLTGSNAWAQLPLVFNGGGAAAIGVGEATLRGTLISAIGADVTIYWGDNDGGNE